MHPTSSAASHDAILKAWALTPVGICVICDRVIQHCNPTFAAIFGYEQDELHGQTLASLYPSPSEYQTIAPKGYDAMREQSSYSDERIMRRKDGSIFWCHVVGRSLDQNNPTAYSVWTAEDLSSKRATENNLTAREREIAQFITLGKTSKEIARQLEISHRTVETHRARIMRKIGASSHSEMIARLIGQI